MPGVLADSAPPQSQQGVLFPSLGNNPPTTELATTTAQLGDAVRQASAPPSVSGAMFDAPPVSRLVDMVLKTQSDSAQAVMNFQDKLKASQQKMQSDWESAPDAALAAQTAWSVAHVGSPIPEVAAMAKATLTNIDATLQRGTFIDPITHQERSVDGHTAKIAKFAIAALGQIEDPNNPDHYIYPAGVVQGKKDVAAAEAEGRLASEKDLAATNKNLDLRNTLAAQDQLTQLQAKRLHMDGVDMINLETGIPKNYAYDDVAGINNARNNGYAIKDSPAATEAIERAKKIGETSQDVLSVQAFDPVTKQYRTELVTKPVYADIVAQRAKNGTYPTLANGTQVTGTPSVPNMALAQDQLAKEVPEANAKIELVNNLLPVNAALRAIYSGQQTGPVYTQLATVVNGFLKQIGAPLFDPEHYNPVAADAGTMAINNYIQHALPEVAQAGLRAQVIGQKAIVGSKIGPTNQPESNRNTLDVNDMQLRKVKDFASSQIDALERVRQTLEPHSLTFTKEWWAQPENADFANQVARKVHNNIYGGKPIPMANQPKDELIPSVGPDGKQTENPVIYQKGGTNYIWTGQGFREVH